jgi:hypothetical protein
MVCCVQAVSSSPVGVFSAVAASASPTRSRDGCRVHVDQRLQIGGNEFTPTCITVGSLRDPKKGIQNRFIRRLPIWLHFVRLVGELSGAQQREDEWTHHFHWNSSRKRLITAHTANSPESRCS